MYNVIAPSLISVTGAGVITVAPGFNAPSVIAAVETAFQAFVNNIGLNPGGGSTICSLMAAYVALSSVPGVVRIDGLQLNGNTNDLVAPFGSQLVGSSTQTFTAN
jgi:hypothetical protein